MTETNSVFEVEACSALASCAVAEAAIAAKTAAKAEVENLIMSGLPLINGWKRCGMDGAGKLGFALAVWRMRVGSGIHDVSGIFEGACGRKAKVWIGVRRGLTSRREIRGAARDNPERSAESKHETPCFSDFLSKVTANFAGGKDYA